MIYLLKEKWKEFKETKEDFLYMLSYRSKTGLFWIVIAIFTGMIVGGFSSLFAFGLRRVTVLRLMYPNLIYFLPLGGVIIVFLYRLAGFEKDPGTNVLLTAVRREDKIVPPLLAPLIFISTLITHLFGGSAGREGAALQMGGSLGNTIGRVLHLEEAERKIVVMCGMSAAFSAVFGTPLAAAIFPMEMISVGIMQYSALVPCVFASIVANLFAIDMGIYPEAFHIKEIPVFGLVSGAKILLLGICCALLSVLFVSTLHAVSSIYQYYFKNPYVKVIVGGILVILMTKLLGTMEYNGAGNGLIEEAIHGEVAYYAFLVKIFMTALTLTAGYKGGEIVPAFCTGATFGCVFGTIFGISPSLCAAVGMIAVFCGVTNCPIASMLIGFELFGFSGIRYLLVTVSVSYMFSGYRSLYGEQIIMYSKFRPKYINRMSGEH